MRDMAIKNSLVIPCYNEEKNLAALAENIVTLPELLSGEVILVDNGSNDGTRDFIRQLSARNENIVLAVVEENRGYGFGILTGLRAARGTYVGWTHADGQMNLADAVTGFSMLWTKPDPEQFFVMGTRRGRTAYERLFQVGMSVVESVLFGTRLTDITAQPKIMTRAFFQSWDAPPDDFSLDLYAYVLAKRAGLDVYKFDVFCGKRLHGSSSWNTGLLSRLKLIRRTLTYSLRLRRGLGRKAPGPRR